MLFKPLKRPGPGEVEPPFFYGPQNRWVGEKPPRRGPDNPRCPRCGGESEIHMHRNFDSDGRFHEADYRCLSCRRIFEA